MPGSQRQELHDEIHAVHLGLEKSLLKSQNSSILARAVQSQGTHTWWWILYTYYESYQTIPFDQCSVKVKKSVCDSQ